MFTMNHFSILSPAPGGTYPEALASLFEKLRDHFAAEAAQGRRPVFVRFFLSDAQNQAAALQAALAGASWSAGTAISLVEQPPLDHSHVTALVQTAPEAPACLFHSLRLTEEEAAGRDSYAQSRLLFEKYLEIIRPLGLDLKTHCVRTWIYVRDIDANYAGLVKARNDVFAEEGLTHDTHYIASTAERPSVAPPMPVEAM